jgi:hypothetical protein
MKTHVLVRLDSCLVLPDGLPDLLLHTVEALCVASVQLFSALLLLGGCSGDERFEVDKGFDEDWWDLSGCRESEGEGLVSSDETEEFVEFWWGWLVVVAWVNIRERDSKRSQWMRSCSPLLIATQSLILLAFSMTLTVDSISSSLHGTT